MKFVGFSQKTAKITRQRFLIFLCLLQVAATSPSVKSRPLVQYSLSREHTGEQLDEGDSFPASISNEPEKFPSNQALSEFVTDATVEEALEGIRRDHQFFASGSVVFVPKSSRPDPTETVLSKGDGPEYSDFEADNSTESISKPADPLEMLVIESKAIELIPLSDLLEMVLQALAATFMIIGGALPYVPQYIEIHQRKSALGFSLLVCLALCVANILRILFWFGKRFETVLLVQSVVMISCMILMLEISVRMNKRTVPLNQRTSVWKGHLVSDFWRWNDLSSYLGALGLFTLVAAIITAIFTRFPIYVEVLGMVALLVEACLGLPQLIRNFRRKSTQGMSVKMVLMWLLGDVGKTLYFVVRKTPAQFYICSSLQITIDILILGQVYFYGKKVQRVPTEVDPTEFTSKPTV